MPVYWQSDEDFLSRTRVNKKHVQATVFKASFRNFILPNKDDSLNKIHTRLLSSCKKIQFS